MTLLNWIRSRKHRYGFGVQGPFAFRIVRDVIRDSNCRYYARHDVEEAMRGLSSRDKRECRMIFRLIARTGPSAVRISDSCNPTLRTIAETADSRLRIGFGLKGYRKGKTLSICHARDLSLSIPEEALGDGNILYVNNLRKLPAVKGMVLDSMRGGWVMHDNDTMLVFPDGNVPIVNLHVKIL